MLGVDAVVAGEDLRAVACPLNATERDAYIRKLRAATEQELQAVWHAEDDEIAVLVNAANANPVAAAFVAEALSRHTWQLEAATAELSERTRLAHSARRLALKLPAAVNETLANLSLTDAGNAEAFALVCGDSVRFDHRRKRWLVWQAPRWVADEDGETERLAIAVARRRLAAAAENIEDAEARKKAAAWSLQSEGQYRRRAMLQTASNLKPIADPGTDWDGDDWLLGCQNGLVDLRTAELRDGRPSDRVTMSTHLVYDPDASAERWQDFLREVFGDPALIDFIQRAVGYSLCGDMSEQVLFVCHGTGANGKSVFLSALRTAFGDFADNTAFSTFELFDNRSGSNDVAALAGKRLVTASETREAARLNEARVKSLTGGDPITARFLYGEFFTFQPKAKLWLGVNRLPRVSDDSYGFWRRIRLIPFTRVFDKSRADPRLIDTLRVEADGILAWAVRGCLAWQKRGLEPPELVTAATEEYQRDSDPLQNFLAEECLIAPDAHCTAASLFKAYAEFAERSGEKPMKVNAFGRRLTERGFTKQRAGTSRNLTYFGIGLLGRHDDTIGYRFL